jgi:hypothetical protein
MRSARGWWVIVAAIAGVAACSSSGTGGGAPGIGGIYVGAGSCTTTSGSVTTCTDFGKGFTTATAMQACAGTAMVTYSASDCPSANRVGCCALQGPNGGAADAICFYPPATATDGQNGCAMQNGVQGITAMWVPN